MSRAVDLSVAGTSCRVVTTADDAELAALTAMVEEKLAAVVKSGRPVTKQAMLLAAIALAHEVRSERARADAIAERARESFGRLLERVDELIGASDQPEERARPERRPEPYRVETPRLRPLDKELGSE